MQLAKFNPTIGLREVFTFNIDGSSQGMSYDFFGKRPEWQEMIDREEDYPSLNVYGDASYGNVILNIDNVIAKLNNLKSGGCSYVYIHDHEDHEELVVTGYKTLYATIDGSNPLPETYGEELHD